MDALQKSYLYINTDIKDQIMVNIRIVSLWSWLVSPGITKQWNSKVSCARAGGLLKYDVH